MNHQFEALLKTLDLLRSEGPASYKTYHPEADDIEGLAHSRSLSFIHLLLKVRFGVTTFLDRHKLITDGSQDGGVDAYFIDTDHKKLFFIQSKLRMSTQKFEKQHTGANDLITMEIGRITKGEETDSRGVAFNSKIKALQSALGHIRDIAKYEYVVIFLGNVYDYSDEQIRKLIDNCSYEKYDAHRAYEKLLFPLTTGTYFDPEEITISLDLAQKEISQLKQVVDTDFGQFSVTTVFIPTEEIGRVTAKYKNALLKFNPRNFLSLQKKSVNENIRSSIVKQEKNNFALLNNGITILSDRLNISMSTGTQNVGQIILTRPQILNGGQTAFTLSLIYEEFSGAPHNPLTGKEVLVKVITPTSDANTVKPAFIELISNATNQQNEVSEADRRSNHEIQIFLQNHIFSEYGYYYERKSGEFHDGLSQGLVDEKLVIDRLDFIKAYWAYLGEPAAARRTSESIIFREDTFYRILKDTSNYIDMFFSYLLFNTLNVIESGFKNKPDSIEVYGYSLMYGKWAVIASIGLQNPVIKSNPDEIQIQARQLVLDRLANWKAFDAFAQAKRKGTKYFSGSRSNFELYYKVNLLDEDIREHFLK